MTPTVPTIQPKMSIPIVPVITRPIVPLPTTAQVPVIPTRPIVPVAISPTKPVIPSTVSPPRSVIPTINFPIRPIVPLPTNPTVIPLPVVPVSTTRPVVPLPVMQVSTTRPVVPLPISPTVIPRSTTSPVVPLPITTKPVTIPTIIPQPMLPVPVASPIKIPVPNLDSPAETFVNLVIAEQDADIMDEKEYLGYVKYLLNDESKYNIFSRLFPENTCGNILVRMESLHSKAPIIYPSINALIQCVKNKEATGGSIAINFSYENHANMLWFDTDNKIINRYDPQVPGNEQGQYMMDNTLREFFDINFPEYAYLGNTLEEWQCVQGVRGQGRTYKSDYYCQDYSLLYAINRINGMSHEEAAFDLVARGEDILVDLAELLRALAYRIRAEMGKEIPERFRNWKP